ncbi:AmmeMemoRadiSam system protein B [Candidatus Omnitrophota bacterium]
MIRFKKYVFIIVLAIMFALLNLISSGALIAGDVQGPAVAGYFYTEDEKVLSKQVRSFIDRADTKEIDGEIIALIAPHAGYRYSGGVAGYAFETLKDRSYKTVIIVAPSHHSGFEGLAVLDKDAYRTPLGDVPIDREITKELLNFSDKINNYEKPFLKEHAAEVQIPFLQESLKDFKIVVILTGYPTYDTYKLLTDVLTDIGRHKKGVLLVASSDLSHHNADIKARKIDKDTLENISRFSPSELFIKLSKMPRGERPCGGAGIVGVMMASKNLGADKIEILKYATSGDASGDKTAVVGYTSAVLYKLSPEAKKKLRDKENNKKDTTKEKDMGSFLSKEQKEKLLFIARKTLESYIRDKKMPEFDEKDPLLNEEMGAFVTLHKNGKLCGCIGNMIGRGPLHATIRDMSIASSTQDHRFSSVKADELDDIDIEISVLSPMEKIDDPDKIIMGKHGVMVREGIRSGVYLPQVATETGWDRDEFMNSLCVYKAGIPATSWKDGTCDIYIFSAEVFGEKELGVQR